MTSESLERLTAIGSLKREPGNQQEFDGLLRSGRLRLSDAQLSDLSPVSRFDLAYNASHAFALAALRWRGYRSENRYVVFQCLPHTLSLGDEVWRVLALCHDRRNRAEYEGDVDIDTQLVTDLIIAAERVLEKLGHLGPVPRGDRIRGPK